MTTKEFLTRLSDEQKPVDYEAELKKCKDNPLYFYDKYVSVKLKPAEWSKEDEEMLEYVIGDVNDAKQLFANREAIDLCDKEIAWLKSLRPSWKPSEEQDYSGLSDLERAIHRGFLCAGVENVPVAIIKETAKEVQSTLKAEG